MEAKVNEKGPIDSIEEYEKQLNIVDGLDIRYLKWSKMWNVIYQCQTQGTRHNLLHALFIFNIIIMPLYIGIQVTSLFLVDFELDELPFHLLNPITASQICVKIFVFWFNVKNQTSLIKLLSRDFLDYIPEEDKVESQEILNKYIKKSNRLSILALLSNTSTVVFWDFLPMFQSEIFLNDIVGMTNYTSDGTENKVLAGWYPFNYGDSPGYYFVFVFEFTCCTSAGVVFTLHELFLAQLVMMLCAHMAILGRSIENLKVKNFQTFQKNSDESRRMERIIRNLTIDHNKLLEAGETLKNAYLFIISFQLLSGMPIMIISSFKFASGISDSIFLAKFTIYCSYALIEIIIYCVGGNEMEVVSESIAESAYESDWYLASTKFRTNIQLIMVRSQTPVVLKAGKLYPVNLVTLDSILQFTYSTTMFLSQIV